MVAEVLELAVHLGTTLAAAVAVGIVGDLVG